MQQDFLSQYIERVLSLVGLSDVTDAQKQTYVPQLSAQLEQRMGLELMPQLDQEQLAEFSRLLSDMHGSAEDWQTFWKSAVPNYEEQVERILQEFAADVQAAMQ